MTTTAQSGPPLDPVSAIRPGSFDAAALLILCLLRSAVPAILLAGLIYAWLAGERGFESLPDVTSAGQAFRVLLSPFVGVAAAVLLRIAVGFVALGLAYPLSRRATGSTVGPDLFRRPFRVWTDRLHLLSAYRALRWTSVVRRVAVGRLGRWGVVLDWSGPVLAVIAVLLLVALVVVIGLNPINRG